MELPFAVNFRVNLKFKLFASVILVYHMSSTGKHASDQMKNASDQMHSSPYPCGI